MLNDNIKFSMDHIWIKENEEYAELGISSYAKKKLKAIMFLNLTEIEDTVEVGEKFGDVESLKTVTDLISPVSGVVIDVNTDIMDDPDKIDDKSENTWLIRIKYNKVINNLMNDDEYKKYTETI